MNENLRKIAETFFPDAKDGITIEQPKPSRTAQIRHGVRAVGAFIATRVTGVTNTAGNFLDGAIGFVSPSWAVRRQQSRLMLRSFQAANQTRLNADTDYSRRNADSELRAKRMNIMALSREEQRNEPFFSNALRTSRNNVIGDDESDQAFTVRATIKKKDGTLDAEKNKEIDKLWGIYKDKMHLAGQWTFNELMSVFHNSYKVSGEVLGVIHKVPAAGSDLNFSIEDLEPDRLATTAEAWGTPFQPFPGIPDGHTILDGIERDRLKRIVAYHILPFHPGNEFIQGPVQAIKVPVERVIHYYEPLRPEQSRGIPFGTSGIASIDDVNSAINSENRRQKIQAKFGVHFEAIPGVFNPSGTIQLTDTEGRTASELQDGMYTVGPYKAIPYGSATPNGELTNYLNFIGRRLACAMNTSYSSTTKDYSGLSFSTHRGEQHEDRRSYRFDQGLHVRNLIKKKIWPAFINALIVADKIQINDLEMEEYARRPGDKTLDGSEVKFDITARANLESCEVTTPEWEYVNPLQEIQADILAVIHGKMTFQEFIGKRPLDEHIELWKAGYEAAKAAGLPFPWLEGSKESGGGGMGGGFGESKSGGGSGGAGGTSQEAPGAGESDPKAKAA